MGEGEVLTCAVQPTESADLSPRLAGLREGGFEFSEVAVDSPEGGFEALQEGEVDLLLISAEDLSAGGGAPSGLEVVATLPLRDWNWVLVSEDRPLYLPKSEVVIVDNPLLRRQLRRYRPDLRIRSVSAHLGLEGLEMPPELESGGHLNFARWAEELRSNGSIHGYVIPRHIHRLAGIKGRRHTLDSEAKDDEFARFLPPPHSGGALFLARTGFPKAKLNELNDREASTSWRITEKLISKMSERERQVTGISVRHRQPAAILNEAERRRDLVTHNTLIDPEGKLMSDKVKIEIQIEMVSRLGDSTISMQRIANLDDAEVVANFFVDEWRGLVRMAAEKGDFIEI